MSISVEKSFPLSFKYKKDIFVITLDYFGACFEHRSDNNVMGQFCDYIVLSKEGCVYHGAHLYGLKGCDLKTLVGKKNDQLSFTSFSTLSIVRLGVDIRDFK